MSYLYHKCTNDLPQQNFCTQEMITCYSDKYANVFEFIIRFLFPCRDISIPLHFHQHSCLLWCVAQILWTFSIYLESVAILPQLFMISKTGEAETITTHYLFFLGLYRALYLINWIWRFYFEGFFDMIAIVAGVVQTILYCDFFYLYVTKGKCCFVTLILENPVKEFSFLLSVC